MRAEESDQAATGYAGRLLRSEIIHGPEWTDGRFVVRPVARTISVGAGGSRGFFFTRTRPVAALVTIDGATTRIPVVDVTRWGQLAILTAALLFLMEFWTLTRTREERK